MGLRVVVAELGPREANWAVPPALWGLTSAIGPHRYSVQDHTLLEQVDLVVSIRLQVPLRVGPLAVVDTLW